MKTNKTHYSMIKPAGYGVAGDNVQIKIVEEEFNHFKIVVLSETSECWTMSEPTIRMGVLLDIFMNFASLQFISLESIKTAGLLRL
jgi:hypothetical protein